jgi:Zn-dependent protease
MSTTRAVRIATLAGVEVRLAPSLAIIAVVLVWTFTGRFRADVGLATAVLMASSFAVLFFLTILAHELAHALEARHRDVEVHSVTLLLFGGVTEMHAHSQRPRDEFVIAAAGPYVSLVCAAAFALVATFAGDVLPAAAAGPVAEVAGLLAWWNLLLALFNLVPGAPLDGGRILRAGLWLLLGDRLRALRIAVRCGQALGIALVVAGIVALVRLPTVEAVAGAPARPVTQGVIGAALLVVLGGFLFTTARRELHHAELDSVLEGRTVAELVGELPPPLPLDALVSGRLPTGGPSLVPVSDGTTIVGVIDTAAAAADESARTGQGADTEGQRAADRVESIAHVPSIELSEDLHALVDRFQGDHNVLRLTRDGEVVGALTERDAAQAIAGLRREVRSRRGRSRRHRDEPAPIPGQP